MSKKVVTNQVDSKIKFIHCRNMEEDGSVSGKGGMTIAYILDATRKVVGFAAAKCHSKDNYCKYTGRAKATGRLRSSSFYEHCPEPMDEIEFISKTREGYERVFNAA